VSDIREVNEKLLMPSQLCCWVSELLKDSKQADDAKGTSPASASLVATSSPATLVISKILTDGVYRIDASPLARQLCTPSLSFQEQARREQSLPDEKQTTVVSAPHTSTLSSLHALPTFQFSASGQSVCVPLPQGSHAYGTGEVAHGLVCNDTVTRCWNSDAFG
jgi:hypothetical protein